MIPRNEVVAATERTLTLRMGDGERVVPWSAVTGVTAARVRLDRSSDQWVLMLALEMEMGGDGYVLLVAETEPAWVAVTMVLPNALPSIAPFEAWGVEVLTASVPIELYQRAKGFRDAGMSACEHVDRTLGE